MRTTQARNFNLGPEGRRPPLRRVVVCIRDRIGELVRASAVRKLKLQR